MSTTYTRNPVEILKLTDAEIAEIPDKDFGSLLLDLFSLHAATIAAVAHLVQARKKAGKKIPKMCGTWQTYLPLISSGAVLPETVAALADRSAALLGAVASLPIEEQRRLVCTPGATIEVWELDQKGTPTPRMIPVLDMQAAHARLVFGNRIIRSATEQIAILKAPTPPKAKGCVFTFGKTVIDMRNKTIRIVGGVDSLEHVIAALKAKGVTI